MKDINSVTAYINAAVEKGDATCLLLALRDVVYAQGGIDVIAKASGLNKKSLYRILSETGNPRLCSLLMLLDGLGLSLAVQQKKYG